MTSLGVTASDVSARVKSVQSDKSGGRGDIGSSRQTIRTLGAVPSVEDIATLAIPLSTGQSVRLDELGKVTDSFAERSSLAYLNGDRVIAVQIKRSMGFRTRPLPKIFKRR